MEGMSAMAQYLMATTTTDSLDDAHRLAEYVLQERLAACAQVSGPVRTVEWRAGQMVTSEEFQVQFMTVTALTGALVERVRWAHHYDIPQVIVTPIVAGNPAYLDWITAQTAVAPPRTAVPPPPSPR